MRLASIAAADHSLLYLTSKARARAGADAVEHDDDSVALSRDDYNLTAGLNGGATLGGLGLAVAAAGAVLGPTVGALGGGAIFAAGALKDNNIIKGFGLAALGGALCVAGAAILGAIPLGLGVGMLAVAGLKLGE